MKCTYGKRLSRLFIGAGFALVVVSMLVVAWPQMASGTDALMTTLPAYEQYKCLLCHKTPSPTPQLNALNAFGQDFVTNGKVWNRTLALLNSDGDRCSNGAEIGDRDGDGVFDDGDEIRENSNPGNPADCTAPVNDATWSIIKEIFSQEIQQYLLTEPDYDYWTYFP